MDCETAPQSGGTCSLELYRVTGTSPEGLQSDSSRTEPNCVHVFPAASKPAKENKNFIQIKFTSFSTLRLASQKQKSSKTMVLQITIPYFYFEIMRKSKQILALFWQKFNKIPN